MIASRSVVRGSRATDETSYWKQRWVERVKTVSSRARSFVNVNAVAQGQRSARSMPLLSHKSVSDQPVQDEASQADGAPGRAAGERAGSTVFCVSFVGRWWGDRKGFGEAVPVGAGGGPTWCCGEGNLSGKAFNSSLVWSFVSSGISSYGGTSDRDSSVSGLWSKPGARGDWQSSSDIDPSNIDPSNIDQSDVLRQLCNPAGGARCGAVPRDGTAEGIVCHVDN